MYEPVRRPVPAHPRVPTLTDMTWPARPEMRDDIPAVRAVIADAFPTEVEATLVDTLRKDSPAWLPGLSYVAESPDGSVAAFALLSRCWVDGVPALAPVATAPEHQGRGAGSAVVRAVLEAARWYPGAFGV